MTYRKAHPMLLLAFAVGCGARTGVDAIDTPGASSSASQGGGSSK
jgi:hypothetical protein